VGTMAVVVLDVAAEDAEEVPAAGEQEMVQAFPAHGADQRSATAMAFGAWIGVRMTSAPTTRQRSSKAGGTCGRGRGSEPEVGLLIKRAKEIPGLLGDPGAGGR
jgi:hypothetical protein